MSHLNPSCKLVLDRSASTLEHRGSFLKFSTIYGVDFSGAKLAGKNTWVARLETVNRVDQSRLLPLHDRDALLVSERRLIS